MMTAFLQALFKNQPSDIKEIIDLIILEMPHEEAG